MQWWEGWAVIMCMFVCAFVSTVKQKRLCWLIGPWCCLGPCSIRIESQSQVCQYQVQNAVWHPSTNQAVNWWSCLLYRDSQMPLVAIVYYVVCSCEEFSQSICSDHQYLFTIAGTCMFTVLRLCVNLYNLDCDDCFSLLAPLQPQLMLCVCHSFCFVLATSPSVRMLHCSVHHKLFPVLHR